jgi:hypothetical protein
MPTRLCWQSSGWSEAMCLGRPERAHLLTETPFYRDWRMSCMTDTVLSKLAT